MTLEAALGQGFATGGSQVRANVGEPHISHVLGNGTKTTPEIEMNTLAKVLGLEQRHNVAVHACVGVSELVLFAVHDFSDQNLCLA
ncbi:hypothetical protein GCM10009657_14870 [Oryzihumus leptocrescens]